MKYLSIFLFAVITQANAQPTARWAVTVDYKEVCEAKATYGANEYVKNGLVCRWMLVEAPNKGR